MRHLLAILLLSGACSGKTSGAADGQAGTAAGSTIGKRCDAAGDCSPGETCKTDFAFERPVCTLQCSQQTDCPQDAECVSGIVDVDSVELDPFCLRPCAGDSDCTGLGSVCDDRPASGRYCF